MLRYGFESDDFDKQIRAVVSNNEDPEVILKLQKFLRENTIGINHIVKTPFGVRRLVYTDFTASGRALEWIEKFITERVLPFYGNTHTLSTSTARQSTFFRNEARQVAKQYLNATHEDALIFAGAGSTGAIQKFINIMCSSRWYIPSPRTEAGLHGIDTVSDGFLREDRWGSYECTLCGVRLKTEALYRAHRSGEMHQTNLSERQPKNHFEGVRRVVILCDPLAHHSSLLPFRELTRRYIHASTEPIFDDSACVTSGTADPSQVEMEVYTLRLDVGTGLLDESDLIERLSVVREKKGSAAICILSAASNVTGVLADVLRLTSIIHQYAALACWDYAATAGHLRPNLNPPSCPDAAVDVAFFSPHKLLGGPGSVGMLLVKKKLLRNSVPSVPGGGVVFFVDAKKHSYIQNVEDREEAGTPDIVGCIRTGLVHHLHNMIPNSLLFSELRGLQRLVDRWASHSRIELLGPPSSDTQQRAAIVSLMIRYGNKPNGGLYLHYNFVVALLNDLFGIQARGGCACAGPYGQHLLGIDADLAFRFEQGLLRSAQEVLRPGFVRIGVHFTMDDEDLALVASAVEWIADYGWRLLPAYTFCVETGEWHHRLATPQQDREWLSAAVPPILEGSQLRELEKSLTKPKETSPPPDLIASAHATLSSSFKGENPIPLSSTRCPVLDAEYADLVWFALPTDASATLLAGAVEPAIAPEANVFSGSNTKVGRPEESIFSVRRTGSPEPTVEASVAPTSDIQVGQILDALMFEWGCDEAEDCLEMSSCAPTRPTYPATAIRPNYPKSLRSQVAGAITEYNMIREGDRLLVGLSGGKDSLTMLHMLLEFQRRAPIKFEIAAATVNPETPEFAPQPLIEYMNALGVEYHFLSKPLIELAKCHLDPNKPSICSFCARMKRGMLYSCMREHKFNVLCLGQHLDDFAESFFMSAFRNGALRTMKANYLVENGDLRVCRPLVKCREKHLAQFATENRLPVIADNCPACFAAPKERHRVKLLLSQQEFEHPELFASLSKCMKPLMSIDRTQNGLELLRQALMGGGDDDDDEGGTVIEKPVAESRTMQNELTTGIPQPLRLGCLVLQPAAFTTLVATMSASVAVALTLCVVRCRHRASVP